MSTSGITWTDRERKAFFDEVRLSQEELDDIDRRMTERFTSIDSVPFFRDRPPVGPLEGSHSFYDDEQRLRWIGSDTIEDAILFMLYSIYSQDSRDDFDIRMETFGTIDTATGMCFGCAATCAIGTMSGRQIEKSDITLLGFHKKQESGGLMCDDELGSAETFFNDLRSAFVDLVHYFRYDDDGPGPEDAERMMAELPALRSYTWRGQAWKFAMAVDMGMNYRPVI